MVTVLKVLLKNRKVILMNGILPVLLIEAKNLAEAWEKTVLEVWEKGFHIKTEYGGSSKDATVLIHVVNPLQEPRKHRGDYVTFLEVKNYVPMVLEGSIDYKIGKGVTYTYHDRLFKYKQDSNNLSWEIDQIEKIVEKLKKSPYSRRAQAITWFVDRDWLTDEPPCLQRVWCRVYEGRLIMETTWRSRDLFHAWGSNAYALTELQKVMAEKIGVEVGQYTDFSNSLHIYEKDFKEVERFIATLEIKKKN